MIACTYNHSTPIFFQSNNCGNATRLKQSFATEIISPCQMETNCTLRHHAMQSTSLLYTQHMDCHTAFCTKDMDTVVKSDFVWQLPELFMTSMPGLVSTLSSHVILVNKGEWIARNRDRTNFTRSSRRAYMSKLMLLFLFLTQLTPLAVQRKPLFQCFCDESVFMEIQIYPRRRHNNK